MNKLTTNTGKEFDVSWCGKSTIDSLLRFAVYGKDMATVVSVFSNSEETSALTYAIDDHETVFTGFTRFRGININPDSSIVVSLAER